MNRSQLRGDLPEPVRRYFLEVATMEPPSDLLDAAVAEIEQTPHVNRFSLIPIVAFAAAVVAAVAILASTLLPSGGQNIGGEPSPTATDAAPSVASVAPSATPLPIASLPPLDGLPSAGAVVATYEVGDAGYPVLDAHGSIWLANPETGTLSRMDPNTGEITGTVAVNPDPETTRYDLNAVSDGTYVWATGTDGTMVKIDPATNEVVERVDVGTIAYRVAIHDGQLWVTDLDAGNRVLRIDTESGEVVLDQQFALWPAALAVTDAEVWMAPYQDDHMVRLDPATGETLDRFEVSSFSMEILPLGDSLYITGNQERPLERFSISEGRVVERLGGELGARLVGDRLFGVAPGGVFMELDPMTLRPMSALTLGGELGWSVVRDGLLYVAAGSEVVVIQPTE